MYLKRFLQKEIMSHINTFSISASFEKIDFLVVNFIFSISICQTLKFIYQFVYVIIDFYVLCFFWSDSCFRLS